MDELKEVYKEEIEKVKKEASDIPGLPKELLEDGALDRTPPPKTEPVEVKEEVKGEEEEGDFVVPTPESLVGGDSFTVLSPPKPDYSKSKYPPPPPGLKTMSSYVDVSNFAKHTDIKELEFLWRARFLADKNSLCATVPGDIYGRIKKTVGEHPLFILPLPREGQGHEFHLLQWAFPHPGMVTCIFTSLAEYQLRKEFAVPHTILSFFEDLLEELDTVFMHGVVTDDKGVSVEEAKWLAVILQKFYAAGEDEVGKRRKKFLEQMTNADEAFDFQALIEEAEKME